MLPFKCLCAILLQDIKHREWPFTRKRDKGHGDYAAAKYDLEFTFSGRLSKPDPTSSAARPFLGESDVLPINQDGIAIAAPATCSGQVALAATLERAFRGEVLH